jgi:hypothetical protein
METVNAHGRLGRGPGSTLTISHTYFRKLSSSSATGRQTQFGLKSLLIHETDILVCIRGMRLPGATGAAGRVVL